MRRALPILFLASTACLMADSGGGLKWIQPAQWQPQAQRQMRLATYSVPAASGDKANAECAVYYFGEGQGGSVDANVDRWIGQFQQPDGKSSRQAAKVAHIAVHGVKVTTIDVSGAYTGMGGPSMQPGAPVTGYRLLGAIAEGPKGSIFIKFTGPAKTIEANRAQFEKMIQSLQPGGD
jgi:hypothetical protein